DLAGKIQFHRFLLPSSCRFDKSIRYKQIWRGVHPLKALTRRPYLDHVLREDHLLLADQSRVARDFEIAGEQPDAVLRIGDDFGNGAVGQHDACAGSQHTDVDWVAHGSRCLPNPPLPPGAEKVGVRWGIPEQLRAPTSPS